MKTILISIQVPDGVEVAVRQSSGAGDGEFIPRPDPEFPDEQCQICGNDEWRLIKAGYSKTKKNADGTAKRFNAFYVCGTEGCEGKPGRVESGMPF